jgi:hypothetical protein
MAQEVSIRSDHPDEYVVVKGDTLWDISGRFLDKPWQWPAIWHANPQIENPHLIYPGDVVSLVYIDGVPQLQLNRSGMASTSPSGKKTVRLSPEVRHMTRDESIKAVPLESIRPFLRSIKVLTPSEFEGLPYIVANNEERRTAMYRDHTYARGLNANVGDEFIVARLTNIYDMLGDPPEMRRVKPPDGWHQRKNVKDLNQTPWNTTAPWNKKPKNPVGYELWAVSKVRVTRTGEISVLEIIRDRTEVWAGDFIIPIHGHEFDSSFQPQAMDIVPADLRVLATTGTMYGAGHYQIVSISGGSNQGIQPGHVFSAHRIGRMVHDEIGFRYGSFAEESRIRLPSEFDGLVMVFRSFGDVSYALVLGGSRAIREFDVLRHPRERM